MVMIFISDEMCKQRCTQLARPSRIVAGIVFDFVRCSQGVGRIVMGGRVLAKGRMKKKTSTIRFEEKNNRNT